MARTRSLTSMALFRTVSSNESLPAIAGNGVTLRVPHAGDFAEWAALRERSRAFLTPWEPTWPADDLTRGAFRRRLKRYAAQVLGVALEPAAEGAAGSSATPRTCAAILPTPS